jgi:hypothetical protein
MGMSPKLGHSCLKAVSRPQRHAVEDHEKRHVLQKPVRLANRESHLQIKGNIDDGLNLFSAEVSGG